MQQAYLNRLTEDDWPALTGVSRTLFQQIYDRYCKHSAIDTEWKLFRVLYVLKTNPTWQEMRVETRARDRRTVRRQIVRHTHILAGRVLGDVERMWASRQSLFGSSAPDYAREAFGDVTFLVDTFPIVVLRSHLAAWRRATYSGKYKQYVLKVQMICNLAGIPLHGSGPHAGVRADINIFRDHKPQSIGDSELGLGDKAYIGDDDVEHPFKKPIGGELTDEQECYNVVLSWLRATVEHAIWQMKKFNILGGVYRGKVWKNSSHIEDCITIITRIIQLQTMASPLRKHFDMLAEEEKADEEKVVDDAEVFRGMRIGRVIDLRPVAGAIRGPIMNDADTDPGDDGINSGFSFNQFAIGDRVLAYWWGVWWNGKVHLKAAKSRTLTIRFDWSHKCISKYKPRCVYNTTARP